MNDNHKLESILTGIGTEPVPNDIHQLAESVVAEFRRSMSDDLDAVAAETQEAGTAVQPGASPEGDDSTVSRDATQPAVRLVPDVPTELADGVSREAHPIEKPPSRRHVRRRFVIMLHSRTFRWSVAAAIAAAV